MKFKTIIRTQLILFFAIFSISLSAQTTPFIDGPTEVCMGECATYYVVDSLINPGGEMFVWQISDGINIYTAEGNPITWCFDFPGTFNFTVLDPTNGNILTEPLDVNVFDSEFLYLYSNSQCNSDTIGIPSSCDQVCAFSTVTYFVEGNNNNDFNWIIQGAEDYQINANSATVQWGAAGTGQVSIEGFGWSGCYSFGNLCVEILENSEAAFTSSPPAINNIIEVCEGQTIYFDNESTGAVYYEWTFGDGSDSNEFSTSHSYPTSGTYEVTLIAYNECACGADTTSVTVIVEDAISPEIDCIGTICAGETVTYTSSADCNTFNWNILGSGTITDGGGTADNFITIEWTNGPEGFIELSVGDCVGDYCLEPSLQRVPIIAGNSTIEGPIKVCPGETVSYTIDDYQGTSYLWTVNGQGTIINGQGTNNISVEWSSTSDPSNPQMVSVSYDNCYLECSGDDQINVEILSEFYISGPVDACENGTSQHSTLKPGSLALIDCNWTVTAPDGSVFWTSPSATSSVDIDWTNAVGSYTVLATAANPAEFCVDEYSVVINVMAAPLPATSIDGPSNVCPGEYVSYEAVASQADVNFKWEIDNGGTLTTGFGNTINVQWGLTGPYEISLTQISATGLPCESDPIILDIVPIAGFTVINTSDACEDEVTAYTTDYYEFIDYVWSIDPASAGTVVNGQGGALVEIHWHTDGSANVVLDVCGSQAVFNENVNPKPEPVVNHPVALCENETVLVQTATPYATYQWIDDNQNVVSTDPTPMLYPGYYELVVTDAFGCEGDVLFNIDVLPKPDINISTPASTGFCAGDPPVTLYALESEDGYDYQWYHDGTAVGTNSSTYSSDQFGDYQVVVTDINGCTNTSNIINLFDWCNGPPICTGGTCNLVPCPQDGLISFEIESTPLCNVSNFINTSTSINPGSESWSYELGGSNILYPINFPTHTYDEAGFYVVILQATVPLPGDPSCWYAAIDTIEAAANFENGLVCAGGETTFTDLSTYLPTSGITAWEWNFDDPTSGTANTSTDQDPTHTFSSPGDYEVTLTITSLEGCTSIKTRTVTVEDVPMISFPEPVQTCEGTALPFTAVGSPNITSVVWDFGEPSSGEANSSELMNTYHAFDTPGDYTVSVTATNIYGCTNVYSAVVTVEPNGLNGDISFSTASPICEGETTTLAAPSGGISWLWSDGSTTNSITVGTEDVYSVTVTNADGCEYTPDPAILEIIPAPFGVISAIEYNDYNEPTSVTYGAYETCEGEDVFLNITQNQDYTYSWNTGESTTEIEFSEFKGNLLTAGTHDFSVDITDVTTGCTNTIGIFQVTVHGLPITPIISASPGGVLCQGTEATISVTNPEAGVTYAWSTGEIGASITTSTGGEYSVTAMNQFGCEAESNTITIQEGPDIGKIPTGCLTRCKPDTLCLPFIPNITSYQWYFDGMPIAAPAGTSSDFVAMESGTYYVELVDVYGCMATSDDLTLDLYDGTGTIQGNVYFDVNDNGIIDGPDTLMHNIDIVLDDGTVVVGNDNTGTTGGYEFVDVLSTDYDLILDTLSLPINVSAYQSEFDVELVGCDVEETIDFLCFKDCQTTAVAINLQACEGEMVDYQGSPLAAGTTITQNLMTASGCDSIITVTVAAIPLDDMMVDLKACPGKTVDYNGTTLNIGDTQTFNLLNQNGCDSIVQVALTAYPEFDFDLATDIICWNSADGIIDVDNLNGGTAPFSYSLDGQDYQIDPAFGNLNSGDYTVFVKDMNGCEKTTDITIDAIEPLVFVLDDPAFPCDKESVLLEAEQIGGDPSNVSFLWEDGSSTSFLTVDAPGQYALQITNTCETIEKLFDVGLEDDGLLTHVYIPNAFSPDGDGMNDLFKPEPGNHVEVLEYELRVFDRWGTTVFISRDMYEGWNGHYKSKLMNTGVYIWTVTATIRTCHEEMQVVEHGDVTLFR